MEKKKEQKGNKEGEKQQDEAVEFPDYVFASSSAKGGSAQGGDQALEGKWCRAERKPFGDAQNGISKEQTLLALFF